VIIYLIYEKCSFNIFSVPYSFSGLQLQEKMGSLSTPKQEGATSLGNEMLQVEKPPTLPLVTTSQAQAEHASFTCKVCGDKYSNSVSLKTHSYIHTAHPFKCGFCGERFRYVLELREHKYLHGK